ncbi:MAG TPA: hypothetical protein VEU29_07905 [Actinomycetota bacterium]|nr:hypothetical protein [Actinomycetota bacterium]
MANDHGKGPSTVRRMRRLALAFLIAAVPLAPAFAETEALDFVRKGVQSHGPDDSRWGAVAVDRDELRRLWDRYEQKGRPPRVRFRTRVAALAGTGGSSTCPLRLHDLRLNRERKRILFRVYEHVPEPGGGCTDDWVPRTFTVTVARSDLKPLRPNELRVRIRHIADPNP